MAHLDFPVGDVAGNAARIAEMIAEARDAYDADVVLFPELALSGYPPEDLLYRPSFLRDCEAAMARIAAAATGIVAIVGWPQAAGVVVYNAASVLRDGGIARPPQARAAELRGVRRAPLFRRRPGPRGLRVRGRGRAARPGDLRGPVVRRTDRLDRGRGAQLVLVPNASPFERDKHAQRDALLAQRVRETGAAIAYLNLVGGQDALVFDGASVVADGDGSVHPAAAAFTDQWLVVDYDAASRRFAPVQWVGDGDESRDALAWRAVVRGTRDYCARTASRAPGWA